MWPRVPCYVSFRQGIKCNGIQLSPVFELIRCRFRQGGIQIICFSEAPISLLPTWCYDSGFHMLFENGIDIHSNQCCVRLNIPLYSNQYSSIGIQFSDNTCQVRPSPPRLVLPWLLVVSLFRHHIIPFADYVSEL